MTRFDVRKAATVIFAMGWADFVLKYRGSVLGYLWSLILPLVKFLVMFHVFRRFTFDIPHYHLYLFLGIVMWEHFSMTTSACISMLHDKSSIIKKVAIPRILLPLATGWTHAIVLCTYLVIFFAFCIILDTDVSLAGLSYVPLLMLQSSLLALGVGMLLSAYALRFRDVRHLWTVVLQVLFWLTPIMYAYRPSAPLFKEAMTIVAAGFRLSLWSVLDLFIRFQPLSILLHDARRALLYAASEGFPSPVRMAGFTLVCFVIFAIGSMVFAKRSRYFVEEY